MGAFAAVMTGQGTGAISSIQVFGGTSETVIKKIFKPAGDKPLILERGKVLLGTIVSDDETVDQVTIGCEGTSNFAINCHGNPLIVEMIMQLLGRHGVELVTAEQLSAKILACEESINTIALEAAVALPEAKTLEGSWIISNQIDGGLSKKAVEWLQNINKIPLAEIAAEAERILKTSQTAKLIIGGCTVVIAGPPNSGKSTLLNCLCGKPKAIVTDIKGTTRDWVSARCRVGSLSVELFDTAGLSEKAATTDKNVVEKASQQKSIEILEKADLVLLVLDNNQPVEQLDKKVLEKISGKKILVVLNKSDLAAKLDAAELPQILDNTVQISAKAGTGIERLLRKIQQVLGVGEFDVKQAVCITGRQENLLEQLKKAESKKQAASVITELLNGQLCV